MIRFLLSIFLTLLCFGFSAVGQSSTSMSKSKVTKQKELNDKGDSAVVYYGVASYYADKFNGRPTANGEIYDHNKLTAACNILPLGTWIRVTNLKNNKSVIVKTNDRLHPRMKRIVDLSKSAAKILAYTGRGLTQVKVEVLEKDPG